MTRPDTQAKRRPAEHPWDRNNDGFWCGSCGDLIARPDTDEDELPDTCRQCGFPDFEDGFGYFTDDAP